MSELTFINLAGFILAACSMVGATWFAIKGIRDADDSQDVLGVLFVLSIILTIVVCLIGIPLYWNASNIIKDLLYGASFIGGIFTLFFYWGLIKGYLESVKESENDLFNRLAKRHPEKGWPSISCRECGKSLSSEDRSLMDYEGLNNQFCRGCQWKL